MSEEMGGRLLPSRRVRVVVSCSVMFAMLVMIDDISLDAAYGATGAAAVVESGACPFILSVIGERRVKCLLL